MNRAGKLILLGINSLLVVVGVYYGVPLLRSGMPTDTRSHEEVKALVEKAADVGKLRAIIISDDATIRADRNLGSLFHHAAVIATSACVIAGVVNLLLMTVCSRKRALRRR